MEYKSKIIKKYSFGNSYFSSAESFKGEILTKKIIPYQVEFQPPPKSTKKICWMECPYCYGLSAEDNGERLDKKRALEILKDLKKGGVKKIIFAGYATDPLNCDYIDDLLEQTINQEQVFGFNTKALKVSDKFVELLKQKKIAKESYISLSIDAGTNETYKKIHNIKSTANIYDKVLENVKKLGLARKKNFSFDMSAAYLVNINSGFSKDYIKFIEDFSSAGCNLLRFTFPQPPKDIKTDYGIVPNEEEKKQYKKELKQIIEKYKSDDFDILLVDADDDLNVYNKARTLPCYARYIYPAIGFDGWLYNCSQSSSPNFRSSALGDLNTNNFWDLFYNYDNKNIQNYMTSCNLKISSSGCRCDRKEHVVNMKLNNLKF